MKNGNGCAASFKITSDNNLFINMIQQASWDETKKTGSFSANKDKPEKNVSIKINMFECGDIINSILRRIEWSAFHTFGDDKTRIRLSTWEKGFGLTVDKNGNSFKLPISFGEAEAIKILMEEYIRIQCKPQKETK